MSHNSKNDITDYEASISLNDPVKSFVLPRWQRKENARQNNAEHAPDRSDRFIPNRSAMDLDQLHYNSSGRDSDNTDSELKNVLIANEDLVDQRVLAFNKRAPAPSEEYQNAVKVIYSQNKRRDAQKVAQIPTRHISSSAVRVLDAPALVDDFYLNLLSWNSEGVIAVGLGQAVFLWNATSGETQQLCSVSDSEDYISSVAWSTQGSSYISIGTAAGKALLWDVSKSKQLRSMDGHAARVSCLSWNNHLLSSGSADTTIVNHDVRVSNHHVGTMQSHQQEICGLTWSPDGTTLASGANDNTVCIWDNVSGISRPKFAFSEHQAAVKALAWSPHERNLLATGGGSTDRCIKFWNTSTGSLLNSIDCGSQVSSLMWSPHDQELLSAHGFCENHLCLWKYPCMSKIKELKGHTSRVLSMALSPDGCMVASAAADETLRFWDVFGKPTAKKTESSCNLHSSSGISRSVIASSASFAKAVHIR